jgi:hypothetical protein
MTEPTPNRISVLLGAVNTWLVTLAAILTIVIGEIGQLAFIPEPAVQILGTALAVLLVAAAIVRRSTEVLPEARGLTPAPPDQPLTIREAELAADIAHRDANAEFP